MQIENIKYEVTRRITPNGVVEELTPIFDTKEEYEEYRTRMATELYKIICEARNSKTLEV